MTDLVKTVQNTIKEHKLVKPGDFVLLGFSVGPDSLCLFHSLLELRTQMCFDFAAVHINHGIRGDAADEDAAWAVNYARSHGVSCIGAVANVPAYAKKRHMTEEEAGRSVRREVFAYIAYGIATGKQIGTRPDDKRPDGKTKSHSGAKPEGPGMKCDVSERLSVMES